MVTKVGLQTDFADALRDLTELDYDAIEAYDVAINRVDNIEYKTKLTEFRDDHRRHVEENSALLASHGEEAPAGPSGKQWLTKGKVVLADMIGDTTILVAMRSNEIDTNTAYERLNAHEGRWEDSLEFLSRGLSDERRHKAWLESIIGS